MRKKQGPVTPVWMERTEGVRPLRPVTKGCVLPTVAMLLALSAFGCRGETTIAADHQEVVQPKHVEVASEDPPPGTGALEVPAEVPVEPVVAKPRKIVRPKVVEPKPPVMLGGAPPPVTIAPVHPPASPKGGTVAVDPTI
jgi:hypothetical protein